ncbi:MAG: 50S ribosomal protein L27 [Candidatus Tagabacteria bacterium]
MAHTKAGGTTKNVRDSGPKYLGIKLYAGETAQSGSILVRQRGTKYLPGKNVRRGRDDTLYSTSRGIVKFSTKRKINFDGRKKSLSLVSVE